jgi:hypothetical protein
VQTFLPYPDFARTAAVLDDRRLGKQRVEALQILRALTRPDYGWRHHPAVLMWKGHEEALVAYGIAICAEWCRRGHADTCETKLLDDARTAGALGRRRRPRTQDELAAAGELPPWLGDAAVHASHRASLLRKDDAWYRPRFGADAVDPDVPYVWPVRRSAG